jgi:hypothetical protein
MACNSVMAIGGQDKYGFGQTWFSKSSKELDPYITAANISKGYTKSLSSPDTAWLS